MNQDVLHHFATNLYAKEIHIPKDSVLVQHKHKTDHLSVLASGKVLLWVDGRTEEVIGPCCLTIRAGQHHGLRALEDSVWFCVHGGVDEHSGDDVLIAAPMDERHANLIAMELRLKGA